MLQKRYSGVVKTISQRELRNDNAAVIRGVEAGESYTVTKNGTPVARLVPLTTDGVEESLPLDRPATTRLDYRALPRAKAEVTSEELLADLRGDR